MNKVYKMITDQIIEKLESGKIPWDKPWNTVLPKNVITNNTYRGFNLLWLNFQDYESPYWGSFKQIAKIGGHVNKHEHGTMIIFWKLKEYEETKGGKTEIKTVPILRYYKVFNLEQTSLIDDERFQITNNIHDPISECEDVVSGYENKPKINITDQDSASFNHESDIVKIPDMKYFEDPEQYYKVLFHELTHSTGHHTRLARRSLDEYRQFGDEKYSKEELVAELGAAFLSGHTGISASTIDSSAGYIQNWISVLKNDVNLIISASGRAQKSTDYILGGVE